LDQANEALENLKQRKIIGRAVINPWLDYQNNRMFTSNYNNII
jgi:hypothetical protein